MSCNCPSYQCIELPLAGCEATVTLREIVADETATWRMELEFGASVYRASIGVQDGQPVTLPNRFNEQYTHILRLYKASGSLFNATCYQVTTLTYITPNEGDNLMDVQTGLIATTTPLITVSEDEAGATYSIEGAVEDLGVSRNNQDEYEYSFAYDAATNTGTWTFTDPLAEGEKIKLSYNRLP